MLSKWVNLYRYTTADNNNGNKSKPSSSSSSLEYYVKLKERPYRECRWLSERGMEGAARWGCTSC